jgi:hypothetical protein
MAFLNYITGAKAPPATMVFPPLMGVRAECCLGGHSISLPDRIAYTVHIYNFVRDFIRAFFKDFPVGGGHFMKRDLSVR